MSGDRDELQHLGQLLHGRDSHRRRAVRQSGDVRHMNIEIDPVDRSKGDSSSQGCHKRWRVHCRWRHCCPDMHRRLQPPKLWNRRRFPHGCLQEGGGLSGNTHLQGKGSSLRRQRYVSRRALDGQERLICCHCGTLHQIFTKTSL